MTRLDDAFGPFDGRIWLNTAQQGPLPRCAAEATRRAIELKLKPAELSEDLFEEVPARLRAALAAILGVSVEEVILGNSASHGLHQIVQGFPWRRGDEVLLVSGDFPATTTPWTLAASRGVHLRWLEHAPVTPAALDQAIEPSTRIFCTTWVHSFLGHALDLPALREVCRRRGVWFVVNASQALGTLPLMSAEDVADVITACGHKFLCGPYGTGVCWIRADLLARLRPTQAYWRVCVEPGSLEGMWAPARRRAPHARRFDVFGTANFFTFTAWSAAIEFLLKISIARIHDHSQQLVEHLIERLEGMPVRLASPRTGSSRSANVVLEHPRASEAAAALRAAGIDIAIREGRMRISPHCHNTVEDIDRMVEALQGWLRKDQ